MSLFIFRFDLKSWIWACRLCKEYKEDWQAMTAALPCLILTSRRTCGVEDMSHNGRRLVGCISYLNSVAA